MTDEQLRDKDEAAILHDLFVDAESSGRMYGNVFVNRTQVNDGTYLAVRNCGTTTQTVSFALEGAYIGLLAGQIRHGNQVEFCVRGREAPWIPVTLLVTDAEGNPVYINEGMTDDYGEYRLQAAFTDFSTQLNYTVIIVTAGQKTAEIVNGENNDLSVSVKDTPSVRLAENLFTANLLPGETQFCKINNQKEMGLYQDNVAYSMLLDGVYKIEGAQRAALYLCTTEGKELVQTFGGTTAVLSGVENGKYEMKLFRWNDGLRPAKQAVTIK